MMKRETELVINTRMMALELIMEIMEQKKYADLVIHEALSVHQFIDKSFRAFLTRLVQGTVENEASYSQYFKTFCISDFIYGSSAR